MIKKILIITFAFLTFSCLGMQDKIDQQKLALIKEKGLRWYLISKINWQEQNEQRNFPELLCDLIAAYADNQQQLTNEIKDWFIKNIEVLFKELDTDSEVTALAYNPHKPGELASGHSDNTINIWNTDTGKKIIGFTSDHIDRIYALTFNSTSPNASGNYEINVWNLHAVAGIKESLIPTDHLLSLAYNPNKSNELAIGSDNATIFILNRDTSEIKKLTGHTDGVWALAYNPCKSNELASGSVDYTIRIWNTDTGEEIKKLYNYIDLVSSLAYNPYNSNELVIGSYNGMIRIWNMDTDKKIKKLIGHTAWVYALAYNPHNPNELTSGSEDKTIRIWNLSNLRKAQRICVNPSMEEAKLIAKIFQAAQDKKKCELDEEEQKIVDDLHLKMNIHD